MFHLRLFHLNPSAEVKSSMGKDPNLLQTILVFKIIIKSGITWAQLALAELTVKFARRTKVPVGLQKAVLL